jgi:AcrR family transcriptional regulator
MPAEDRSGRAVGPDSPGPMIWERVDRATRGPQPLLTHQRIARSAIEIADAEGLDAVSMRKIAARLGAGTMSLYRYVGSKQDLVDLAVDEVLDEGMRWKLSGDWRADLAEVARDIRRVTLRHPWLAGHSMGRPAFGPNMLRAADHILAAVDGLGLDIDGMLDMWLTVSAFVSGYVLTELAEQESLRRSGLTEAQWRAQVRPYVRKVVESGRYPLFSRIIVEAEDFPDPDAVFERRLGYVLDGLPVPKTPS